MFSAEHADVGALIVLDVATLTSAVGRHASLHEPDPIRPPLHGAESLHETDRFEAHLQTRREVIHRESGRERAFAEASLRGFG